jgi:S1-C subfamily serine protease
MSFLRWFFTDACPNCKSRIASSAKYCSTCGWGNQTAWRNCTSCGRSVGADSNFCWGCHADLRQQPQTQVVSDCWRREPGVAAIRIPIETPETRLRNGIQVDDDTRGVFLRNGIIARDEQGPVEIGPGYHPLTTFSQRLFGSKPSDAVEALIATLTPVEVRIDATSVTNILTSDYFTVEGAVLLKLKIDDLAFFQRAFMPRGKDLVNDDELGQPVTARVIEVLRRFASRRTSDLLLTDPDIRRALEAELGDELPRLLAEAGLTFHGVVDVRFGGDAIERKRQLLTGRVSAQMEAAELELRQKMDLAAKTGELKNEDELQSTIDRIAHDRCLTRLERDHLINIRREFMRREHMTAAAHTDGQVHNVQVDYQLEAQRKRDAAEFERKRKMMQLEKEEDEQDLDTLGRLRKMQMETLAAMKQVKVDAQVKLAQGLHGLDPLAQIAGAGLPLAPHMVAGLRAMQPVAQPVYMAPSPQASASSAGVAPGENLEDIVPRYIPAVGLVLKQNAKGEVERVGTAWIAQGRGVLVTNAHVAAEVDPQRGGGWVVFPGTSGESCPIASVQLHPAYVSQLQVDADGRATSTVANAAVLTHDVAIIRLSSPLPHSGVPIAPRHRLYGLRELQPVAYVGYPMRDLAGAGASVERPRPVAKRGTISSLTDWQQRDTTNQADAHLIRHDLGVTGGASGSPLWDAEGNVIGIVCGMNVERVYNPATRKFDVIPNAALVNFAQRIDVLTDWQGW